MLQETCRGWLTIPYSTRVTTRRSMALFKVGVSSPLALFSALQNIAAIQSQEAEFPELDPETAGPGGDDRDDSSSVVDPDDAARDEPADEEDQERERRRKLQEQKVSKRFSLLREDSEAAAEAQKPSATAASEEPSPGFLFVPKTKKIASEKPLAEVAPA
jgi:hypothetical protein